ncbi:MAG: OmpA family protein [Acidaminococcaceae bacterium]|jgi:outer membrane protein OmpA-like peptidoglycan-associated protein|nr:OmpA family protein [Acidaminococcaceae bacterium]
MKRIFLMTMCALALSPAFAQTSTMEEKVEYSEDKFKVETNRFWSNWFITVGGGAQIYFGDHDKQSKFGDRLAPALDVMVGKWFTPGIGLRIGYSGLKVKGATKHPNDPNYESSHGTGEPVDGGQAPHYLEKQKFDMANFHADVLFNFSNLFFGYNPERVWNSSPYVGLGWARVWKSPSAKEVSANIGWLNSFRLSDAFDVNLDVRGMFVNDRFDSEGGGRFGEGNLSATVGFTYKFKQRSWGRSKTVYRYDYGDLEGMRQKLNDMSAENERLKRALAEGKKQEAHTIVKKMAAANLVTFQINKTKLSNEARANLGMLAEVIKQGDSDVVYTISGYADAGTGSSKINERLSKGRAESVYDCLVKEFGVKASQLRINYKGGVENMFYDDPRLSRAVITRGE